MPQRHEQKRLNDYFPAGCRLGLGGYALVAWYDSFTDSTTRMFRLAQTQDGGILIWWMGMLGIIIVVDAIFNDFTPTSVRIARWTMPFNWKRALEYRHFIFTALAACYAIYPFIAQKNGNTIASPLFFYWNAFLNIGLAFLDAKLRTRSIGWQRAYS